MIRRFYINLLYRLRIAAGCDCIYCNLQIYGAIVRYCIGQMLRSELFESRSAGHVTTKSWSCGILGGPQPQKGYTRLYTAPCQV
jgi:hypothetical protein